MDDNRLDKARKIRRYIEDLKEYIRNLDVLSKSDLTKLISFRNLPSYPLPIFESDWIAIHDMLLKSLEKRLDEAWKEYNSI